MQDNPRSTRDHHSDVHLSPAVQIDELQQLYEQAPCGYHSLDENGLFIRINQTELTMLGYDRSEILGKKRFADLLTPDSTQIFAANFPIFKQQGYVQDLEFHLIRKNGDLLPVSLSATAIKDADGNFVMTRSVVIDISERQRLEADRHRLEADQLEAELALRDAHQRIVGIWESMTDAYVTLDAEWRFIYVNHAAAQVITHLTGIAPGDILGKTHGEVFPALVGKEIEQRYRQATAEQAPVHFDNFYAPTGDWFEIHIYPSAIELGVYFRDISDRKTSESELLRTEERLRYLLASNPAVLYACQASGDFAATFISENITVMLGYEEADFLADGQFWANHIHPDDAPQVFAGLTHLFEQGTHTHEYRFQHQDGSYRWVLDQLKLVADAAGNPLEIVGYWIDITDRKESEQKIREQANLLAIATDAIFVHNLDNQVLFWNQGAERLYGWSEAAILGQDWRNLLSPDTRSELATVIEQGHWQGEVTKVTQTGQSVVVMSRRSVMLDGLGQPKSILTVDTDITEKKQLETQFLRAQRLESLGTLSSGIAHDLNNVLTPIIGIVQLLPHKIPNLDPQTQRLLQILNDSARRGADLVKQILSFTRGLEGKPTSTEVTHLLAEIQRIIRQAFPKNIELSLDLCRDLWLIAADATMLHQVFMNLCVNARDAMPNGGQLSIKTENLTIDKNYARMNLDAHVGPYVVVTIADTGMGIPPDIIERIFDPFFTTKDIGKGTGLGLSTVIGIVKSHQGFINVYSEVGKGTRFTVYLPATEIDETKTIVEADPPYGQGELILVVDDETAIQEITQVTLESHGYTVMTANDGIEAIALYAEHKQNISAVLLDLMMPSLDSATTMRTLHKLDPQVRIIAMSGLATNESVTKTMKEGVQAFLAKPFTAPELLNLLARILLKK